MDSLNRVFWANFFCRQFGYTSANSYVTWASESPAGLSGGAVTMANLDCGHWNAGAVEECVWQERPTCDADQEVYITCSGKNTCDAIITSLLRQNDVATSFWHNNDVIITPCTYQAVSLHVCRGDMWKIQKDLGIVKVAINKRFFWRYFTEASFPWPLLVDGYFGRSVLMFVCLCIPNDITTLIVGILRIGHKFCGMMHWSMKKIDNWNYILGHFYIKPPLKYRHW